VTLKKATVKKDMKSKRWWPRNTVITSLTLLNTANIMTRWTEYQYSARELILAVKSKE